MHTDPNTIGEAGTRFFGKISATVSHEIKNGLAVINENAGLLKDLILMAQKGRPLDPGRLDSIADKVLERVARADDVVRDLNRFAHKVDDPVAGVDLSENLALMAALTRRLAANRGKNINISPPTSPVQITTNPFALLNLLWCCMETAMDAAPKTPELSVSFRKIPDGAQVRFAEIEDMDMVSHKFGDGVEALLTAYLGAGVTVAADGRILVLTLPEKRFSEDAAG